MHVQMCNIFILSGIWAAINRIGIKRTAGDGIGDAKMEISTVSPLSCIVKGPDSRTGEELRQGSALRSSFPHIFVWDSCF